MSPVSGVRLDVEALSGILGSISIACWVVVFTPQIVENFRRHSAEGLSLTFLVVWLLGDVFNILGAVLQGVLPTMIILAVYYTLADIVLLLQCFYYRGLTLSDGPSPNTPKRHAHENEEEEADEDSPLLARDTSPVGDEHVHRRPAFGERSYSGVDGTHLSPATPLVGSGDDAPATRNMKPVSMLQSAVFNTTALVLVCGAGAFGWWLSARHNTGDDGGHFEPAASRLHSATNQENDHASHGNDKLPFDTFGQLFGYLCAALYLASRLPQLLLNYRRQSTEGVSVLFFLFACFGNATYVLSILAYDPVCRRYGRGHGHHGGSGSYALDGSSAGLGSYGTGYDDSDYHHRYRTCPDDEWRDKYAWYVLVNLSWLIGSAGTLVLDFAIFVQFWIYKGRAPVTRDASDALVTA